MVIWDYTSGILLSSLFLFYRPLSFLPVVCRSVRLQFRRRIGNSVHEEKY